MNDAWYVAEPDGTTVGPMSRDDVVRAAGRGQFSALALAWHVDLGEWWPLSRILLRFGRTTQDAPTAAQTAKVQQRQDRQKQRELPPSQRSDPTSANAAEERRRRVAEQVRPTAKRERPLAAPAASTPDTAAAAASARLLGQCGKRLLARGVDVLGVGLPLATLWWASTVEGRATLAVGEWPSSWMLLWMACAAWFIVETLALTVFGTTPGKLLLGLELRHRSGGKPGLVPALQRSFTVYSRGVAFGIAFLTPFTVLVAGAQTLANKRAPWDQDFTIVETPVASRWQLIGIVTIALWVAAADGWWLRLAAQVLQAPTP